MSDIQLYTAPGTCARVPAILLGEADKDFETVLIRFLKGEHKSPEYKKINPKGKVPAIVIDGEALTENVAIITYLHHLFPDAELMPQAPSALEQARYLADLCFCSATLHPIVTRIRMPQFFASEDAVRSVWQKGCDSMAEYFDLIDKRLENQPWWYGKNWSAIDAYLYWIYWRVEGARFDVELYANFRDHAARMEQRPAVKRALAREAAAVEQLEKEGLMFKPPQV